MYYENVDCPRISDAEKSPAVTLPLFWVQYSIRASEWQGFLKVAQCFVFLSNTNEIYVLNVHLSIF